MRLIYFLSLSLFFLSASLNAEPVKIGIITDLSAGMNFWGQQTITGARVAEDQIKAEGGELEIYFSDHQLQTKHAISEFQKMTEINQIDALYSEFTPTSAAISSLVSNKKTVMIYAAAAESIRKNSEYIFKTYLDFQQGCTLAANYWKSIGVVNVGLLTANLEFGQICSEAVKKVFPDATDLGYNPGDDLSSHVLTLKSKKIEAIVNVSFEPDQIKMLKAIRNIKWNPRIMTQSDSIGSQTRKLFKDSLQKIVVFALPEISDELVKLLDLKRGSPNEVALDAAGLSYLHVRQLYTAVKACKSHAVSERSNCIAKYLSDSVEDKTTGFAKWEDRRASFKIRLLEGPDFKEIKFN